MINIYFKKLNPKAEIPAIANPYDAGIDFKTIYSGVIDPYSREIFQTGLAWEPKWKNGNDTFKNNFKIYMKIYSRSGLASNGVEVGGGVIDQEYRGEIKIILFNRSSSIISIKEGDKIAQGIIYIIPQLRIMEVETLTNTVRGEGGFGSTGI